MRRTGAFDRWWAFPGSPCLASEMKLCHIRLPAAFCVVLTSEQKSDSAPWRSQAVLPHVQASVQEDPVAWWRHAINATRHACRSIRRHQAPLRTIERRRRARMAYQALYAAARCGLPSFQARPSSHSLPSCDRSMGRLGCDPRAALPSPTRTRLHPESPSIFRCCSSYLKPRHEGESFVATRDLIMPLALRRSPTCGGGSASPWCPAGARAWTSWSTWKRA